MKRTSLKITASVLSLALASVIFLSAMFMPKKRDAGVGAYNVNEGISVSFSEAEDIGIADEFERHAEFAEASDTPDDDEIVNVIITLDGTSVMKFALDNGMTIADAVVDENGQDLVRELDAEKEKAIAEVDRFVINYGYRYSTVFNGFSADIRYGDLEKIKNLSSVKSVILGNSYTAPDAVTENYVNVYETGIYNSSDVAYDGTGTVVAILDTGTDYNHEVFDMELDPDTAALTKSDIAALVPLLTASSLSAAKGEQIDQDDLYISSKLPFAYDYADRDADVYPLESHGTHVAGIVAGKSERITGVAPRAQIATFKVFPDADEGAQTSDLLAAISDAVLLGVDAINMSLGSACGFASEEDDLAVNEIYDSVNEAGICLIVAAGNTYSSAFGSKWGNTNLASNPDSGTVSSPASYKPSLAVASINGVKTRYFTADGGKEIYFAESHLTGKTENNDFIKGLLGEKQEGDFDYVVVPGVGLSVNYMNLDVSGKIAVVSRGNSSFEEKVRVAAGKGAAGVIIYNNVSGSISMTVGTKEIIPSCSITKDNALGMLERGSGTIHFSKDYLAGPFMSDFSSWGVLPDLELSPDITAHGGEILSSVPGNNYEVFSGTSMASPNLAGAIVLVRQAMRAEGITDPKELRDEVYSRIMSTAGIAENEDGNPYSPRKQGAGLADIAKAIDTKAYLTVEGSNKPKLSLGDDPARNGAYQMKFRLINKSGDALSYRLSSSVMTESMSSDERTVAEKPYMFDDVTESFSVSALAGEVSQSGNYIFVGGYSEVEITASIILSAEDKTYLESNFVNGMYVEGFIRLGSSDVGGIDLGIPFLAFYGDWTDAPMLDVTAYQVGESAADDSVLEADKLTADVYGTLPYAGFASTASVTGISYWGMGQFAYIAASGYEDPLPQEKYASLTTNREGNYIFYAVSAGLLRSAKEVRMEIRNASTGELIWSEVRHNSRKSYSNGGDQVGGFVSVDIDISALKPANNSKYRFSMECFLDRKDENGRYAYGNNNKFSFEFTIDDEAPVLEDVAVREVKSGSSVRHYLDLTVYDNHYLQGVSMVTFKGENAATSTEFKRLADGVIPVETEFNASTTLSFDISGYWNTIQEYNGNLFLTFYDYAKNVGNVAVKIKKEADIRIEKTRTAPSSVVLAVNGQRNLKDYLVIRAKASETSDAYIENYWTENLTWVSSAPEIVEVRDGVAVGKSTGTATITVCAPSYNPDDLKEEDEGKYWISFDAEVTQERVEMTLTGVELNTTSMRLERGETSTLKVTLKPWAFEGNFNIEWNSSSANVEIVSVSADGLTVTLFANKVGSATVWASVSGTRLTASCSVSVVNEFVLYNNIYLRTYVGRGDKNGLVEIPDDLGIVYIYPSAFSGNRYIKKVIIPDGVTTIMEEAFYECTNLEEIVLPESVTSIDRRAFAGCPKLKTINLNKVNTIKDFAFASCISLREADLESCTVVGRYAFAQCSALSSLDLSGVGAIGGGAFSMCTGLVNLEIPKGTVLRYDGSFESENNQSDSGSNEPNYGGAFSYCTALSNVTIAASEVGDYAFLGCRSLSAVTFTGNVSKIGASAFSECSSLSLVNFGGTVEEIGERAFWLCRRLTDFTLPDGLRKIGKAAFNGCDISSFAVAAGAKLDELDFAAFYGSGVTEFVVEPDGRYLASDGGVLYDCAMRTIVAYPYKKATSRFVVPSTVKTIGSAAFSYTTNLTSINLSGTEYVDPMAFAYSNVSEVSGYENVRYYGEEAFLQTKLTKLPICEGLVYIGDRAFAVCGGLSGQGATLTVPHSVEYIGDYAFAESALGSVSFENSSVKITGTGAFANDTKLGSVNFGGLKAISDWMFAGCTLLSTVMLPETVESLGVSSFEGCSSLSVVRLSSAMRDISPRAFAKTALTEVTLPENVITIGDGAFSDAKISSINLDNVTYIGKEAFARNSLEEVSASSVKEVGDGAFYENRALIAVSLPNATAIGKNAFYGCNNLKTVNLGKAEKIGDGAFGECLSIASVSLDSAKEIGKQAFENASKLETVEIPVAERIGESAFAGTAIKNITLPATLKTVEERAFAGAVNLSAINVENGGKYFASDGVLYAENDDGTFILVAYPAGKTDSSYSVLGKTVKIDSYAFYNNTSLENLVLPVYLKVIGASAFEGDTALKEIMLNAVNAPTLESYTNVYSNFNFKRGETKSDLSIIIPANSTGYDSRIWKSYVGNNLVVSDELHATSATLDFIDRVKALENGGDAAEIAELKRYFDLFDSVQKKFITGDYVSDTAGLRIDAEYYRALLGGVNYYDMLLGVKGASAKGGAQ